MSSTPYRVLIARFYHESNRLNPQASGPERFSDIEGDATLNDASGVLAGLISGLSRPDVTLLPTLSIGSAPSGLVDHDFYLAVKARLLDYVCAHRPDALALELHGAMGTTEIPDAEGDLLAALRREVGPDVPIGVGLDLHAHLTPAMLRNATFCIACKENPHSDTIECGEKAAIMLMECLSGRLAPVTAFARVPMVLPGAGETATGPLADIHERARAYQRQHPEIRDISIYNVFRFTDDDDIGQVVTVTTNGEAAIGPVVAGELAEAFWLDRERFKDNLLSIDDAFALVETSPDKRPFVLGDMGDRILAGAPGDSVALLSAVLARHPTLSGAISVTDAASVAVAYASGVGATVSLDIGGGLTPGFIPVHLTGRVVHLSDGAFVLRGPFHGGEASSLGRAAVVIVDERIHVLLTTLPAYAHDPAVYTSQAIPIADLDFAIAKSGYHFMLNYDGVATPILVETPGVGYYQKGLFAYEKARFWPEHDVAPPVVRPVMFRPVGRTSAGAAI